METEILLMDVRGNDLNGCCKENPIMDSVDPKTEKLINGGEEEDSDCDSLLPPRSGGMSRKSDKIRRKVQWNDKNGNKLVEILEFEPSDVSDSDDEDSDSCICTLM